MVRSPRPNSKPSQKAFRLPWRDLLDVLAIGTWSMMLMRYWIGGKLSLLLHPDYSWLSNVAAIVLLLLAGSQALKIFKSRRYAASKQGADLGHVTLLPPSLSSAVLLGVAVFGLIYTPKAFASETAVARGIADSLTLTRSQPQRFVRAEEPAERTIIDWIRLVNVYPEPDAYAGEAVSVSGFAMHPDDWPEGYIRVSRFVLTCCAADAYPVGLPVKLAESRFSSREDSPERSDYPVDSWIEVEGEMTTGELSGRRQLVILPTAVTPIEEPKNPYEY